MRRLVLIAIVAGLLTATAGCTGETRAATPPAGKTTPPVGKTTPPVGKTTPPVGKTTPPAGKASTEAGPGVVHEADIYVQVLRRYLGTPADNSFPGRTFTKVYLLDQAFPDAGDPDGPHDRGTPIGPDAQRHIAAALKPKADVAFIADRNTAIETRNGCAQTRDGGILITLGTPTGDDQERRVAIYGFVACLGATWLTYVVRNEPDSGWRVTGTTGSKAIA